MNRIYTFLFFLTCLLCSTQLSAQDPHFSQFYAAPLHYNPAMTGVYSGKFRVALNYREQWGSVVSSSPFRTIGASFDARQRVGKGDFIGLGFSTLRDQAGEANFARTQGHLNFSYLKQLSGNRYRTNDQYLIGGLQLGGGQHTLDYNRLWFSNQFDEPSASIDPNASSGELLNNTSDPYLDLNAGLLWYALFGDNASIYVGGAVHHVNAPRISFFPGSSDILYMRWVGQVGGELPFSKYFSILPSIMVMGQGPSFMSLFGGNLRYTNRDWREVAIRAGVWGQVARSTDASGADFMFPSVIFSTILEMERMQIGLSYDVNAGVLSLPTNGRGAFEISMVYIQPASRRDRVQCPKF